tara:strand:+ start:129 stop:434 length:306 start_codon:yes stop_codon:yes gene_type:complete
MDSQIVSSKVAELKGIPTKEELNKQLRETTLVVTFNKLNGDERVMTCTKDFKLIPESHRPKTDKEPPEGNVTVWDINANGWRSFKYDRVTKVTRGEEVGKT